MRRRVPGCPFCEADQLEPLLLAETRRFALATAQRPLAPGHLVLLPREHLPSFAALLPEADAELRELLGRIDAFTAGELGLATVVENWPSESEREHAHAHVLPDPHGQLLAELRRAGGTAEPLGLIPADLAALHQRGGSPVFAWRAGQAWALLGGPRPNQGLHGWLAERLAAQGVPPPADAGPDAVRRWRRAWQRYRRDSGGPPQRVVTCFLRRDGRVCLFKRSDLVESAAGKWHGISGYLPDGADPLEHALEELQEETGLSREQVALVRAGAPVPLGEPAERPPWLVHPFLFELLSGEPRLNWEHQALAWIDPGDLERYDTVPWLPRVYQAVAE